MVLVQIYLFNYKRRKYFQGIPNGAAELYYDGSKKFETTSSGATITGTCTATAFAGDGSALTGISAFVAGMILIWSGAANAIPSGWNLCDGTNGTPNLTERFVVGAGGGGNSSVNSSPYSVGDTGGATTDSITVSVSGNTSSSISQSPSTRYAALNPQFTSVAMNPHSHSFSGSGSATVNTRPPYYALCYIMKT